MAGIVLWSLRAINQLKEMDHETALTVRDAAFGLTAEPFVIVRKLIGSRDSEMHAISDRVILDLQPVGIQNDDGVLPVLIVTEVSKFSSATVVP